MCAIDNFENLNNAIKLIGEIHENVGAIKLGLEFFYSFGINGLKCINEKFPELLIFLDLKIYDIPNTVSNSILRLNEVKNIIFFTIPADTGQNTIKSAISALRQVDGNAHIAVVTKLTSSEGEIEQQVMQNAKIGLEAGARVFVAPAEFANKIKEAYSNDYPDIFIISPGIRPADYGKIDDQVKIMTPGNAIKNGSDALVIGRPITESEDKIKTITNILQEIQNSNF